MFWRSFTFPHKLYDICMLNLFWFFLIIISWTKPPLLIKEWIQCWITEFNGDSVPNSYLFFSCLEYWYNAVQETLADKLQRWICTPCAMVVWLISPIHLLLISETPGTVHSTAFWLNYSSSLVTDGLKLIILLFPLFHFFSNKTLRLWFKFLTFL